MHLQPAQLLRLLSGSCSSSSCSSSCRSWGTTGWGLYQREEQLPLRGHLTFGRNRGVMQISGCRFRVAEVWHLRTDTLRFGGQRGRAALKTPLGSGSLVRNRGCGQTHLRH